MKINITSLISVLSSIQLVACASEPQGVQHHSKERSVGNTSEELTEPIVVDLMTELRLKKIKISRWGQISKSFDKLKIGLPQDEVERLLGKRDVFPKEQSIWQYAPNEFRGGADGPDWNLVIHMKDEKVSGFQLLKYVFGPPPG